MLHPCPRCGRPIDTRATIAPAHTEYASERVGFARVRECKLSSQPMPRPATAWK